MSRALTNCTKEYTLETQEGAVLCPFCHRPFRVVRVRGDTTAQNLLMRCSFCKREICADINGTSARYKGQRR